MIGCDKFCTYCIVPQVRGPEQSRHPDVIAAEVRQLADEGCKEVTLLGQTVNSYKYAQGERTERLSDLLSRIHDTPGVERINHTGGVIAGALPLLYGMAEGIVVGATYQPADETERAPARPASGRRRSRLHDAVGYRPTAE